MARKVIGAARNMAGPRGSWRRRWATLITLVIIAGAGLVFVQTVLAVKDAGFIEMDGDANTNKTTVSTGGNGVDDWDNVCYQAVQKPVADGGLGLSAADAALKCGANAPTAGGGTGAVAVSWIEELSSASTIFTAGGSKDPQDVSSWLWKDDANNPPDKDNIEHSYAARYRSAPSANCPNGTANNDPAKPCDILFFGMDRSDASGDANTGFWFFQNKISLSNISSGGGTKFDGVHLPGDILIISGFSNGGTTATISVYKWDPFCAADGKNENSQAQGNTDPACKSDNLRLVGELTNAAAECATSTPVGGQGCGIVNPPPPIAGVTPPASIIMPWVFINKSGTPGNGALNGEFFEAGINLSMLNLQEGCFSSMLAETRTSTSPTSVLKDFVLGGFGSCETSLSTTSSLNSTGASIGAGSVSSGTDTAQLTINGVTTWGGDLKFYLCGPVGTSAVCDANGVLVTTKTVSNSSPASDFTSGSATLTRVGRYCWFVTFTVDTATAAKGVKDASHAGAGTGSANTECFTVSPVTPTLDTAAVSGSITFNSAAQDNASINGLAKEPGTDGANTTYPSINATNGVYGGKLTFFLVGPGNATPPNSACSTLAAGFPAAGIDFTILPAIGNGTYGVASYTPTAPGLYSWKVQYVNASAINNSIPAVHNNTCADTDENVLVQQIPTQISTAPYAYPQDSASIKVASGSLPVGGSVEFKLFNSSANCTAGESVTTVGQGGLLYREVKGSVVPASPATSEVTGIATNNTSFKVDTTNHTPTYFWRVTYTPGGTSHTPRSSTCVESTLMTHTNHAYPGS